ncbi:protein zwilch homolog isoform X2 [Stegostoma tigrinum]|uniref:protein zwilch homolog isoform X2 n=1 Tax=Stegostoma tigrinum TaxID=3053191 RepID=UPI002870A376|nr:protein zwilch homolog isoform X2 [Stegostoma tigrinum]
MDSVAVQSVRGFHTILLQLCDQEYKGLLKDPMLYEDDIQVHIVNEVNRSPLQAFWKKNVPIFIAERASLKVDEDQMEDSSINESNNLMSIKLEENMGPLPLSVMKARQLVSWYTLAHNPHMAQVINCSVSTAFPLLWVRCDGSDPEGTVWLGAEPVNTGKEITSIVFHIVTCTGPIFDKNSFPSIEKLKIAHKDRHPSSAVITKGYAQYDLFGTTVLENTLMESQSNIMVDFTWNNVDKILEIPPLTSAATLNIKAEPGDVRSPVIQIYKELEFLLVLAQGLKTGETEWPELLEEKSAVTVVQELIEDLKNQLNVSQQQLKSKETEKLKSDAAAVESTIHASFAPERGDLDFAELLWTGMRKTVSSYQDVVDCLALVIQHLKCKDIQPWDYFVSCTISLEEQMLRLQKLHHVLELVVSCSAFLNLNHENLFTLTQSCLRFYKDNPLDEQHVFQLPIRPTTINAFYENEHPIMWRMEIISCHGQRELKTVWQLNTRPPVDHVTFNTADLPVDDTALNHDYEEAIYYNTVISCSQAHFM